MSQDKTVKATVAEKAEELVDDTVEKVEVSKEWLEDLMTRLERAERPVRVKVVDSIKENRRKLVIAGVTVTALGAAAAYAVTHKEDLELVTEKASEAVEHKANDVKQDAREARTGKRTK